MSKIEDIINIFNEIKSTSKRTEKEQILKENENNQEFKKILKFVYDPLIVTGLAEKKIQKEIDLEPTIKIGNIIEAIDYLLENNTGSDLDIKNIQSFIKSSDEAKRNFYKSILIKDLPIGISSTTLNKVYGSNFIKKHSVMLASTFNDDSFLEEEFSVSLKIDGIRATVFNHKSSPKIFYRSGKKVIGLNELEKSFLKLPLDFVYDGELILDNPDNINSKDLFRETQSIVRSKKDKRKNDINFILFDKVPINEFENGKSNKNYEERLEDIEGMFKTNLINNNIKLVPIYYRGKDKNKVDSLLTKVLEKNYEGLMINLLDGYYETRRSKSLLKVKKFNTVDLKVKDIIEHTRGNKLGSVIVEYKKNLVQVGSGFTDQERDYFWENKKELIGKIIEIQYFEESENIKNNKVSLRFPTFIRVRFDKKEESYF